LSLEQTPETHTCRVSSRKRPVLEVFGVKTVVSAGKELEVESYEEERKVEYFRIGDRKL
jgi:hypothetical protein